MIKPGIKLHHVIITQLSQFVVRLNPVSESSCAKVMPKIGDGA